MFKLQYQFALGDMHSPSYSSLVDCSQPIKGCCFRLQTKVFYLLSVAADSHRGLIHFRCHCWSHRVYLCTRVSGQFKSVEDALGILSLERVFVSSSTRLVQDDMQNSAMVLRERVALCSVLLRSWRGPSPAHTGQ